MSESPQSGADDVLLVTVCSEGSPLPDSVQLVSLVVHRAINRVPTARLVFHDGDISDATFAVSDSNVFRPGAVIRISAGYRGEATCIFEGMVVKHALKVSGENNTRLMIECCDKAVAMTAVRKSANYVDKRDSDIIRLLLSAHQLSADVEGTALQHSELVQYYCSDWDFLLVRAEANGLLVIAKDGEVAVKAPDASSPATLKVSYGVDLMAFEAEIDARTQFATAEAVSWDVTTQCVIRGEAGTAVVNQQGNLDSATLAEAMGLTTYRLQTGAPQTESALTQWAKARQLRSALARIRGRMSFQGSAKATVGGAIELEGVGERFNGKAFVSSVTHTIADGDWVTEAEFGLSPQWFTEQRDVMDPVAAGLLPGVRGLQIGVVMKLDGDPEGQYRLQVKVPVMEAETEGIWARLLQFHGSKGSGAFFVPEVGDEVVLGYLNHDPSHPVILGSLYSSMRPPANSMDAENNVKAFVTRCKSKIEFNEADKSITVTTPGHNKIVLSDASKSIQLHDQSGNTVELNANGVTVDSSKDIVLRARGKVSLEALDTISVTSKADVKTAGLNISVDAQVGFTAKGSASAELSAAGQTLVKGAIVMIN